MLKRILLVLIAAIIIAVTVGLSLWFKPKPDYKNSSVDIRISADSLFNNFSKNEKLADSLYISKIVQVRGTVSQISENQMQDKVVVLQTSDPIFGISCTMQRGDSAAVSRLKSGQVVMIKGLCTGFTTDVVITNASVAK